MGITKAFGETIPQTGMGVFFTALNFARRVSTCSFAPLQFQADRSRLLTTLPEISVVIDTLTSPKKLPCLGPEPGGTGTEIAPSAQQAKAATEMLRPCIFWHILHHRFRQE